MVDLGKYAGTVLGAYGATIAILVVLVVLTMRRSARVRARLTELEQRREDRDAQG